LYKEEEENWEEESLDDDEDWEVESFDEED